MLLRRLLDPEETARRRRLRAQIVRRNRIQRELAQGLEPKWRRVPRGTGARTVHDYGWNPLEDGTAAVADERRVENHGNALAFLVKASTPTDAYVGPAGHGDPSGSDGTGMPRLHSPAVMEGVQQVPARFANRVTASEDALAASRLRHAMAGAGHENTQARAMRQLPGGTASAGAGGVATRQYTERVRVRWHDVRQLLMIQRHEAVLRKDASRTWRHERLGLLLFERKRYKEASEHLATAITLGATRSLCWRRLAQCHWYDYETSHDWDALWDAKAAFEQALTRLEMACIPYVLYEYARVLEALGSYSSALNACASLLTTFPKFALTTTVQLRFVLLQRYQWLTPTESVDRERAVTKCLELTKSLLLDASVIASAQYPLVLYTHVRLNELLYETTAKRGDEPNTVAMAAKRSADVGIEELFKAAVSCHLVSSTAASVLTGKAAWTLWWRQSDTFLRWADHFQSMNETIAAADALARALELMEMPAITPTVSGLVPSTVPNRQPVDQRIDRKIALYLAMASNYYQANQMERAIRAMETVFQLTPYIVTVRQSLAVWFPAKWKDRLELEDASQVQIARVLRGLWGRATARQRRHEVAQALEAAYRANPYHPRHRRNVLRLLKPTYAPLFLAQDMAVRRLQQSVRSYLQRARIRWAFEARHAKVIQDLRAKYGTRKYRYNRTVRFQLTQLVPDEFDARFRHEDRAAGLVQRWFRGERVRRTYRAMRNAFRAQQAREGRAATCIQRTYRRYRQRCDGHASVRADELLFETQRRLHDTRKQLARQLQQLYHQWKHRLVRATRLQLQQLQQQKQYDKRSRSATRIQRRWRRHVAHRDRSHNNETSSCADAAMLLDELRCGHARVLAEEAEAYRVEWTRSAQKIQAAYRGKRVRASLVKITRQHVEPAPSEIALLLHETSQASNTSIKEKNGSTPVAVLPTLDSVKEKRALFDFPIIVLRPSDRRTLLPLDHLTAAIQHSSVLHTLVIECGDLRGPRITTLFQSLQHSKTLKVLALGAVWTQPSKHRRRIETTRPCSPAVSEGGDDDDDDEEDDGENADEPSSDEDDDDDHDRHHDDDDGVTTPMRVLYETLRAKTFLLEQLLLDGNDLCSGRRHRDATWLAQIVGDYFYGRYGKLRVLAAQRMALSDTVAAQFGDALAINTVLQRLNVSGNAIRDAGAVAIARQGLAVNATLVYLNVADNAIGSAGARALFTTLERSNRTLRTLVLTNNLIMNDAVTALFDMLQANAVVEQIDLRGNLLHMDHLRELDAALQERAGTANDELRLFLARRRLRVLTQIRATTGVSGPTGRESPLSPVRQSARAKGKRHAAPLSPQQWIRAYARNNDVLGSVSLLQSPCVVFKDTSNVAQRRGVKPSPAEKTVARNMPIVDTLLFSSPSKTQQKPAHRRPSATRLPVLLVGSPPKVSRRANPQRI